MLEEDIRICRNKLNRSATNNNHFRDWRGGSTDQKKMKMLCGCLRSKRNRITKIAPIHEEPQNLEEEGNLKSISKSVKIPSCLQTNPQETKIYKNLPNARDNRSKVFKQLRPFQPFTAKAQSLACEDVSDIKTVSGSLLKSSLHYKVDLHQQGSILYSQIDSRTTINELQKLNRSRHSKCLRLECFYWLLGPFRRKRRKTDPKVQAIVYKTYYVKWTKPPDTLTKGYGVKTLLPSSVLRRCRSALF